MRKIKNNIFLKTTLFLAIFFATVVFLNINYSNVAQSKAENFSIKSDNKEIETFTKIDFNPSSWNPIRIKEESALSLSKHNGFYTEKKMYESGTYNLPYKANAVGVYWDSSVPENTYLNIEIKLKTKNGWQDWQKALVGDANDGKNGPDPNITYSELIFDNQIEAFKYRVTLDTKDNRITPVLKQIKFNYIDSSQGPEENKNKLISEASASVPGVIPRASWGCPDPNNTMFQGQSNHWPVSQRHYEKIIIHHTVNTNSSVNNNPASVVRGVWQYHAVTLGWGDVGYNYLVDRQGRIYEGRFGGENTVGGHAWKFNWGSIGIAMLGTYTAEDIPAAARETLAEFAAERAGNHLIDPNGTSYFLDQWTPNIGGHREYEYYDPTCSGGVCWKNRKDCPGSTFWGTFSSLRAMIAQRYSKYAYPWQVVSQNSFTDQSMTNLLPLNDMSPGQTATLRLVIKNTSQKTWYNSGLNPVLLGSSGPKDRSSAFSTTGWINSGRPALMKEAQVNSGESATFIFNIKIPAQPGVYREYFTPVIEGFSWMSDLGLHYYITVTDDYRWELTNQSAFTDLTFSVPFDTTKTAPNQEFILKLKAKNIGKAVWYKNGSFPVRLGTSNPNDRASLFYTSSWINSGRPAGLSEDIVTYGNEGTFIFKVKAPSSSGTFLEGVNILAEGVRWMSGPNVNYYVLINGTGYDGELISANYPQTMITGEKATVIFKVKNTGNAVWYKNSLNPVSVGTSSPIDRESVFTSSSWINSGRPARVLENTVLPGQVGTFTFEIQAPQSPQIYNENFDLLAEGIKWFGKNIQIIINVKGTYKSENHSIFYQPNLLKGQSTQINLSFKNTGTATWQKNGSNPVVLGTTNPRDRQSVFASPTWINQARPAKLNEDSVAPGETGTFTFTILANSNNGSYDEYFSPVAEGENWTQGLAMVRIVVSPPIYAWQLVSQSSSKSLDSVTLNDEITLTLKAKNTGNLTWQKNGSNPVVLGTTNPRDRQSVFASPTWINQARPAKLNEDSVAPGETGTFVWNVKIPKNNGIYHESVSLLAEGLTWMNDPSINYRVVVNNVFSMSFISQAASADLNTLKPADQVSLGLTVRNTGNTTWKKNSDYPVRIGTSSPNDRQSLFYDSSWIYPARPASMVQEEVKPNEIATFEWIIKAPVNPGVYRENYNLVVDGITWFKDLNINYYIVLSAQTISVSSGSNYHIYLKTGETIATVPASTKTTVFYWDGNYYINNPSFSYSTNQPVRFVPTNGVMALDDYIDKNWDGSINDNWFRNVIEIIYSPTSNKLWAVNEVSIEDYLKGIAESSNTSPIEHLKVMSVASRGYANYHLLRGGKHADEPFHLKNSRNGNGNDQQYKGYRLELRMPNLVSAVSSTANEAVFYNGAPVITPYSRGNSPRTLSALEAWGWNNTPWLLSVADPYGDPNTPCGINGNHCVGLSASGSVGYANAGFKYKEILNYYYTGTTISNIGNSVIRIAIYGL